MGNFFIDFLFRFNIRDKEKRKKKQEETDDWWNKCTQGTDFKELVGQQQQNL